ncbi:MAG: beta-galactosidase [Butyrivibrio sp.]|nr:beta-galactosidase [Butyrivibrio sp.]
MKITACSKLSFDNISLLVDGKRWFPMMGEMHFSRYPKENWEEELYKMKAGGIDIVSLYVIWIHHEEVQGEFDFTGDRNLKDFLETVKKCGMYSILRIGPWAHGEARNGGFPDWLLEDAKEKGYEVRTDAPEYLKHVRRFYEKTYEQAKGFFIKDEGPVIGIQIENEYGHCGGKTGDEGEQHMKTLLAMAKEIGFITPIYTATGWGGAVTGGMLPVMGGYCEAPWDQRLTEIEPSGNYIFTKERNDHNIGSDHGLGAGITFDMDKFPYLTAELGGGLQVTHHRRPIASGLDTAAMTMVKLGSGANLLGYYMYHGGTNPKGKLTTLQESRATGYPNDLPEYSYDFNAPLREYGQMEDTYREVRLISSFIHDFGSDLCDMAYTQQPGNPLKPDNLTDLRTAVRCKEISLPQNDSEKKYTNFDGTLANTCSGYLFVNNYQRRYKMAGHEKVELKAYAEDGKTVLAQFPARDINDGDFFFYPFNMPVGDSLVTVDATPLCIVDEGDHKAYIFYTDSDREASVNVKGDLGNNRIIIISREEAVHSAKVSIKGKEYLIISEAEPVTMAEGKVSLLFTTDGDKTITFRTYPELQTVPEGFKCVKGSGSFAIYESSEVFPCSGKVSFAETDAAMEKEEDSRSFLIEAEGLNEDANEVYMLIDYVGDTARFVVDGEVMTDSFYTGQIWEIGLKRYCMTGLKARIDVTALHETDKESMYLQTWPEMKGGRACDINAISLLTQYRVAIN